MCGIAGVLGGPRIELPTLKRMTRALSHRGPDDEGFWIDEEAGIGLGHRRLSIVDLSPAGHQPMHSPSGRFVITFNGEIYNHAELRRELAEAGHQLAWRGHSDTETLLAGFDFWGVKATLQRASGMFAFGLWDKRERALILARDRLGEKPLYYGRQGGSKSPFLFGSELKALREHPAFVAEIDREALSLFVRYLDVPAPLSIYRGISKLLPGTFLTLKERAAQPFVEEYWSGADVVRSGVACPSTLPPADAVDEFERILERAVGRQMMSDVPLGAFLSGGVDSSTVVAIMQKISSRPVKTFTIGFNEPGYNEAEHAKAVANHLGTDHTELYVTPEQAMDVIPRLPTMYDEPFADSSQIPTHLVAALARKHVTVSLSGDGGDELFGGYDRYRLTMGFWDKIAAVPLPLRAAASRALTTIPKGAWDGVGRAAARILPRSARLGRLGEKVHKGAPMLESQSIEVLYDRMVSHWRDPRTIVAGAPDSSAAIAGEGQLTDVHGVERMMAQDMLGYLPDDILVKVDRAAMAVSLETRVPLLDPEVVEFAWRLPLDLKIRGRTTKWILRQVLYRHVPPGLIERPKMGFGIPLDRWLRGPLRGWAEALLDERRVARDGFFHAEAVRTAWNSIVGGDFREQYKIWGILMFQAWLDAQQQTTTGNSERQVALAAG
jgi:asparagine synthase (glutamine-hydrolysing)